MAVDTQEKRMSAAGAGRIWIRSTFPVGATDEQSRMGKGAAYNGNALSAAAGRIMASLVAAGGLVWRGGIAGRGGGLAG